MLKKILIAAYHDLVLLEIVGKYWHVYTPFIITKLPTFCWAFLMFQFQIRKQVNIFYVYKKTFGCQTINFDVRAKQQSCNRVFVLLDMIPFQTRDGVCKNCGEEFHCFAGRNLLQKIFNSAWNEKSWMAVSNYRGIDVDRFRVPQEWHAPNR